MATSYFLKVDGIEGESTNARHAREIDLLAFSWGATQTGAARTSAGGGAGRVNMQEIVCTMRYNQASVKLFLACANGLHIKTATITLEKVTGGSSFLFLTWKFSDILVSGYTTNVGYLNNLRPLDGISLENNDVPLDQVRFSFGKVEVEYKTQAPDGTAGATFRAGWDLARHIAI